MKKVWKVKDKILIRAYWHYKEWLDQWVQNRVILISEILNWQEFYKEVFARIPTVVLYVW